MKALLEHLLFLPVRKERRAGEDTASHVVQRMLNHSVLCHRPASAVDLFSMFTLCVCSHVLIT